MEENKNVIPDIIIFDNKEDEYYRTINLVAMFMDDLSWKAKGLHYYIRTRPKGWKIWINDLINKSTDGETSVRAGIKELLENKLLYRLVLRDDKKRISGSTYISFARPTELSKQDVEKLFLGNPNLENKVHSIKTDNINKNINKKDISLSKDKEKGLEKPSSSKLKTITLDKKKKYNNNVYDLFNYWQNLNIIKHREGKTKEEGLSLLNKNINKHGDKTIKFSFDNYKRLLNDPYTKTKNKSPYKVSLPEFFKFSPYTKDAISKSWTELSDVKSWFLECRNDYDYLKSKYGRLSKDRQPLITTKLKEQWGEKIGQFDDTPHNENSFRKAACLLNDFVEDNYDKLCHPDAKPKYPATYAKIVIGWIAGSNKKNKHPGWMTSPFFFDNFKEYLMGLEYLE